LVALSRRRVRCLQFGHKQATLSPCSGAKSTSDNLMSVCQSACAACCQRGPRLDPKWSNLVPPADRANSAVLVVCIFTLWSSGKVSRRADRNDGVVGWNCSLAFRNFRDNCLIYQMQGSGCTPIVPGHIVTWATQPTHDARQLSNSFCAFWVRLRVPIDRFSETRTLDVHVVSRP
jgi:hypothetical protein